jgi:hypothetical protein
MLLHTEAAEAANGPSILWDTGPVSSRIPARYPLGYRPGIL